MTKTAVITGGSSGLGFELANILVQQGYSLVLIARDWNKLCDAKRQLNHSSSQIEIYRGDITNTNQIQQIAQNIEKSFGQIDLLVLNAGIVQIKCLLDYSDFKELQQNVEVNLWGTILTTRLLLPLVRSKGQLLFVSSGFGLMGAAGYTTYCATKAGIINFAEALRRELLAEQVTVQVVVPPDIATPQYYQELKSMPDWMRKAHNRATPLPPRQAATRIVKKLSKHNFLIVIDNDVRLLILATRFLPKWLRDKILDQMFPWPKASSAI